MKQKIYFDNAATTALDPEVLDAMIPYFTEIFGNPSSIHSIGRKAKAAVETARKNVATILGTSPSEIFFTSGGTEANNTVLNAAAHSLDVTHFISSPLEHHAVLHPLEHLNKQNDIKLDLVNLLPNGDIDFNHLESIMNSEGKKLVSLMHGNNESGNILNTSNVTELCKRNKAYFHSDLVQTTGKLPINFQEMDLDFASGSAHKFHGPKGIGFLYINARNKIEPFISGGAQERNMRGGTENISGIVGLAKALEIAVKKQEERKKYILSLKAYFKNGLDKLDAGITYNGASGDLENSLYHLLNVSFPSNPDNDMLLFNLDIEGICVSGGSACSSGTDIGSHVLRALQIPDDRANVRFSFSSQNTFDEIDRCLIVLKQILNI